MSALNAVKDLPTRAELKTLRQRLLGVEDSLSNVIQNNTLVAAAGVVQWFEQDTEPVIGDVIAIWNDTTDGRLRIKKKINANGDYDWVRIVKA